MDPFDAECLLIALGFERFLSQEAIKTTIAKRNEAMNCPKHIERELKAFLDKGKLRGTPMTVDFDYDTVREQLDKGLNISVMSQKLGGILTNEASEMGLTIARPYAFLQDTIPRRARQTALGIEYGRPSDREIAKFRWGYIMAVDPMAALTDLQSGCLTFIESEALLACYPAVHGYMLETNLSLLTDRKEADTEYKVPRQHRRMLDALYLTRSFDMGIAAKLQQSFIVEKEPAQVPPRSPAVGMDMGEQVQSQVGRISTAR